MDVCNQSCSFSIVQIMLCLVLVKCCLFLYNIHPSLVLQSIFVCMFVSVSLCVYVHALLCVCVHVFYLVIQANMWEGGGGGGNVSGLGIYLLSCNLMILHQNKRTLKGRRIVD